LDGVVRQWRRLLPLFVLGGARLRPYRAGRHLCARLSADRGGAALRCLAAAKENPPHRHDRTLIGSAMDETLDRIGQTIKGACGDSVTDYELVRGELTVHAKAADIVKVARFLHDDPSCQFICIIDITAVDWPGREQRFDVVYHFLSPRMNTRVRVKIVTDETTPVASLVGVYRGADWFERETYDLYGVLFTGH